MNRGTWLLSLLLFVLISGCAVEVEGGEDGFIEEGEVVLANPDDEGKGDTVFGKTLRYAVRDEWNWFEGDDEMTTGSDVMSQTDTTVRVSALRIALGLPPTEILRLSIDAESFNDFGELSTDMAFLLFIPGADRTWQPTHCAQNYFESAVIDTESREIDVVARGAAGDTARTFSFSECGIPDGIDQVAIFPFPSSNWWSLEGYYHLKIEADCGSRLCPAGRTLY